MKNRLRIRAVNYKRHFVSAPSDSYEIKMQFTQQRETYIMDELIPRPIHSSASKLCRLAYLLER